MMNTRRGIVLFDAATDPPGPVVPAGTRVEVVIGSEVGSASLGMVVRVLPEGGTRYVAISPENIGPDLGAPGAQGPGAPGGLATDLVGAGRFVARGQGIGSIDTTIGRFAPSAAPPPAAATGGKGVPLWLIALGALWLLACSAADARPIAGVLVWGSLLLVGCASRVCVKLGGSYLGFKGRIAICGEPRDGDRPVPSTARVVEAEPIAPVSDGGADGSR